MVKLGQNWILPILGDERTSRRLNRVFPESRTRASRISEILARGETVTTARTASTTETPTQPNASNSDLRDPDAEATAPSSTGGVVRQWVSELAGAARPNAGGEGTVRVPRDSEIDTLTAMFPDVGREVIVGVLQRRFVNFFPCPGHVTISDVCAKQFEYRDRRRDSAYFKPLVVMWSIA